MTDDRDEPGHEHHLADDLAAGQGLDDGPDGIPAEDVVQLAAIRNPLGDEAATIGGDEVEHRREGISDVRVYEGYLEAGEPVSGSPDGDDEEPFDLLDAAELREGETENPDEAAEEGLAWIPPVDPPVVRGDDGQPQVAAGFGMTADDEPYDADHHARLDLSLDERTERVREALIAHAETTGLMDRLRVDTDGDVVFVEGTVDDLVDEEAVLAVIDEVEGVEDVVNRIEVLALQ